MRQLRYSSDPSGCPRCVKRALDTRKTRPPLTRLTDMTRGLPSALLHKLALHWTSPLLQGSSLIPLMRAMTRTSAMCLTNSVSIWIRISLTNTSSKSQTNQAPSFRRERVCCPRPIRARSLPKTLPYLVSDTKDVSMSATDLMCRRKLWQRDRGKNSRPIGRLSTTTIAKC